MEAFDFAKDTLKKYGFFLVKKSHSFARNEGSART